MVRKTVGWGPVGAGGRARGEVGTEARKRQGSGGKGGAGASSRAALGAIQGAVKTGFMGREKAMIAGNPLAEGVSNMELSGQVRRAVPCWRIR